MREDPMSSVVGGRLHAFQVFDDHLRAPTHTCSMHDKAGQLWLGPTFNTSPHLFAATDYQISFHCEAKHRVFRIEQIGQV